MLCTATVEMLALLVASYSLIIISALHQLGTVKKLHTDIQTLKNFTTSCLCSSHNSVV